MNLFSELDLELESNNFDHFLNLDSQPSPSSHLRQDRLSPSNCQNNCVTSQWLWTDEDVQSGFDQSVLITSVEEMRKARENQEEKVKEFLDGLKKRMREGRKDRMGRINDVGGKRKRISKIRDRYSNN